LAAHRDPESYVGGGTPLNRDAPRFSRGFPERNREARFRSQQDKEGL
jgi:hypothetical protein